LTVFIREKLFFLSPKDDLATRAFSSFRQKRQKPVKKAEQREIFRLSLGIGEQSFGPKAHVEKSFIFLPGGPGGD
jgi:hypothetical protein